jgi:hypothetical protein
MSGILSQRASTKSNIGLRNLFDVNEGNFDRYRPDTIYHNQLLVSYNVRDRPKEFVFKYITDLLVAGTGITFTTVDGVTTIDASGGVSPLTTKGDLYTFDTVDARLPVGTNGQVLYADSTTATGLKWDAAPTGGSGIPHGIASGTDTYTVSIAGVTSYAEGDAYIVRFTNGNTTSCTLNINGLGAVPLYRNNDGALIGGDIIANGDMLCVYDTSIPAFRVIGTAPNTLLSYVTNDDSVTLTKGMVVYAFGGTGDRMTVKRASNTSDATSAQTVGLVLSTSIAANQKGLVMMQGLLDGLSILPTSTFADGEALYLGSTAGSITNVKPYAPSHLVYLGVVTTASPGSSGRMYVKIQNGYELDELHNVQATAPTYKDTLWYDNTVSPAQWKTASLTTILGYTPVPSTRSLTINGTTYDLSADRTWTIAAGGTSATIGVTIDGSGGTITSGIKGYVQIPYACTINSWRIIANASGSTVIDVWKTASPTIPTVANTITGSAKPTLSVAQTNASSTLTGWTTSIAANDILAFNVDSATTVAWVILQLFVTKL